MNLPIQWTPERIVKQHQQNRLLRQVGSDYIKLKKEAVKTASSMAF